MRLAPIAAILVLVLAGPALTLAQPLDDGPKWLHHHAKKNPHQGSVRHAKPSYPSSNRNRANR
jgi:hypothetical protein